MRNFSADAGQQAAFLAAIRDKTIRPAIFYEGIFAGEQIEITSSSVANPTIITSPDDVSVLFAGSETTTTVVIANHVGSAPKLDASLIYPSRTAVKIDTHHVSLTGVNVSVGGTGGTMESRQPLRLWSGLGTKSWDSKSWLGAGHMLGVSGLKETSDISAVGFSVSLSGATFEKVSLVLQSCRQGEAGKIWFFFKDAAGAMISVPYLARQGRFDVPRIDDTGTSTKITFNYEDRLIDLERPRLLRYTSEDQNMLYPNLAKKDLGFDMVELLQDAEDKWGAG